MSRRPSGSWLPESVGCRNSDVTQWRRIQRRGCRRRRGRAAGAAGDAPAGPPGPAGTAGRWSWPNRKTRCSARSSRAARSHTTGTSSSRTASTFQVSSTMSPSSPPPRATSRARPRESTGRPHVHDPARADRRGRVDLPVELPAADGGVEDSSGYRRRKHHRAQTLRADAADSLIFAETATEAALPDGVINVVTAPADRVPQVRGRGRRWIDNHTAHSATP